MAADDEERRVQEAVRRGARNSAFAVAEAAQRRGSVKVFVQPPNDSLEAMATLFFSSRSVRTWKRSSAPWRSSSMCWVGDRTPCTVSGVGFPVPARRTRRASWPRNGLST